MEDRFKFRVLDKKSKTYLDEGFEIRLEPNGVASATEYYDDSMGGCGMNVISGDDLIVEFCTGLKDKNGKLIFEGDIVETWKFSTGQRRKAVIKWNEPRCGFRIFNLNAMGSSPQSMVNVSTIEVLGNIYDNPELMEDNKI